MFHGACLYWRSDVLYSFKGSLCIESRLLGQSRGSWEHLLGNCFNDSGESLNYGTANYGNAEKWLNDGYIVKES